MKTTKIVILLNLFLIINLSLIGQVPTPGYIPITADDFNYKECPFEKSAEAVMIYDIGESRFVDSPDERGGYEILFSHSTRIKILKDGGEKWANVEIPIYQSNGIYEIVSNITAVAYNYENGEITKTEFSPKNVFQEKLNDHWLLKKFAIPNVKVGTIIDIYYQVNSQYIFNLHDWDFQYRIPVLYSKYTTKMVPFYQYTYLLQRAKRFDESSSSQDSYERFYGSTKFHDIIYTFVLKDLPAFKDEEFISNPDDYKIKLHFQLSKVVYPNGVEKDIITTWPLLKKELIKESQFGHFMKKGGEKFKDFFSESDFQKLNNNQKFDSIVNFVKLNFHWNGLYRLFADNGISKFLKSETGNSAEINLFTIGLLNKAGIKAFPIIISTRENGKPLVDYPLVSAFNNVLIFAEFDNTVILSDATNLLLENKRIPSNCINGNGLIVENGDEIRWINLESTSPTHTRSSFIIHFNEDSIKADMVTNAYDYSGLRMHNKYGEDSIKLMKEFDKLGFDVYPGSVHINDMKVASDTYQYKLKMSTPIEKSNNKIYVSPFLHQILSDNPLKFQERKYPIDFISAYKEIYNSTIEIPNGYKVEYIPGNKSIDNDEFELTSNVIQMNNTINFNISYYFKKPIYAADRYINLKEYFDDIVDVAREKIVFVKE